MRRTRSSERPRTSRLGSRGRRRTAPRRAGPSTCYGGRRGASAYVHRTGRTCRLDSRAGLLGVGHDLSPRDAHDPLALRFEPGLPLDVVLARELLVVPLLAVGFDDQLLFG